MSRKRPAISIGRIYDLPNRSTTTSGVAPCRVLVDRLWPRGLRKEAVQLDLWLKEIAPSTPLRKWFHAHPEEWDELRRRYFAELDQNPEAVEQLLSLGADRMLLLLYAARDEAHNNAVALREYLQHR